MKRMLALAILAFLSPLYAADNGIKPITSFEDKSPFNGSSSTVVEEHATDGKKALKITASYASMDGKQDWSGYDYLKADMYTDSKEPLEIYVEIRDTQTKDYWTRVNYSTVIPAGKSTFLLPVKQMYIGEKSRPGPMLKLAEITRLVFAVGDKPTGALYIDNVRLERDDSMREALFDGLKAFDFGSKASPVMDGFTQLTPETRYTKESGFGILNADVWRAFDVLQPEPLYQDFICFRSGGIAVDVPNGVYQVFVNLDSANGYWGEYPVYDSRAVIAEGKEVVKDTHNFESFKKNYYRFWDTEDSPAENTFDKYQKRFFQEKRFEVEVADGQLNLEFRGPGFACAVSALMVWPKAKAAEGEKFLKFVENRRRFHFDNYFKRVLHQPTGDPLAPTDAEKNRGYVVFTRDYMSDIYYNDTPFKAEIGKPVEGEAFAGEYEPITVSLVPLKDLGKVTVAISDLTGAGGKIPSSVIDPHYVSYRLSRSNMEGSINTITPRLLMPRNSIEVKNGVTRTFWFTVKTPADAKPGEYTGQITLTPENGAAAQVPVKFRVRSGKLDPVDVPAGPWGHSIDIPWNGPEAHAWNDSMITKSLKKLREYGFTTFSGIPYCSLQGFKDGKPVIDFSAGDAQMKRARELGFTLPVVTYCGFGNLNLYYKDTAAMQKAGFNDYSEFIKAVFTEIQKHADENNWLPVYWNIGDEPIKDDLIRSAENAEAYRKAFPKGPPYFTAASSFAGKNTNDPHYRLSKALHVADWNLHDEDSVKLIHDAGGDWAFYNGGNRWTFGAYMYKAVRQFRMKFRISWHWNCAAGDPYYALDCREDDYAWCNGSPNGDLIASLTFEKNREGLDDYRQLITLERLAKEKAGTPAAEAATKLINERMAAFKLNQREHDALFKTDDWKAFRAKVADAIEALRK
ncbi:MAG TPA: glycoside hydrolase domain-containing protein [Planctomycetota bacterium]|nr:glycoside hydrolase domain-containing protein [Planctomycetota bacterium]